MEEPQESPTQRQARLRREKREKKILSGATSRLEQITSLSGGRPVESSPTPEKPVTELPSKREPPTQSQAGTTSQHTKWERTDSNGPTQAELEASMRELLAAPVPGARKAGPKPQEQQEQQQDPMLALLQQMMSGSMPRQADGNTAAAAPSFDGLPPGLAAMLGGGIGGGDTATGAEAPAAKNVYVWKIAHALFSLCLGVYVLYTYTFSGTFEARMKGGGVVDKEMVRDARASVFWVFVTAELGLQGARYLLEGGAVEEGMVKSVAGFLPQPWRRRVELGSRYVGIWTTVVQDAFVVLFLLGIVAWWKG